MTVRRPLEGLQVLDFAQFLAGPMAALRLADLGAEVTKVEPPRRGEAGRSLLMTDQRFGETSGLFQTINRNKSGVSIDLKTDEGRTRAHDLVATADVVIQNFKPGVMQRLGLGYGDLRAINPGLVYASITGYGDRGEWTALPGQDLLVQARSGLLWMSGDSVPDRPVPIGISLVDVYAGSLLTQGILAALVGRGIHGVGMQVDTSLLEAAMDLQFQEFTGYLNGSALPRRCSSGSAHSYLDAPYGVYACADGWVVLAMNPLERIGRALAIEEIAEMDPAGEREQVMTVIARRLADEPVQAVMGRLEAHGAWAARVLTWEQLLGTGVLDQLEMLQQVRSHGAGPFTTLRCPVRFDGQVLTSDRPAPRLSDGPDLEGRD